MPNHHLVTALVTVMLAVSVAPLAEAAANDGNSRGEHTERSVDLLANPRQPDQIDRSGTTPSHFDTLGTRLRTVRVEIVPAAGEDRKAKAAVLDAGGRVVESAPGVLLADLSGEHAATLADTSDAVAVVRQPVPINVVPESFPASTASPLPTSLGAGGLEAAIGADAWHVKGYTGQGVRVGLIDYFDGGAWASAKAAGTVPDPSGVFCRIAGSTCNLWDEAISHGVAVAEGIHAVAPDAELYLATVGTTTDLAAAIDWFEANGVTVVSRSLISILDSPGNGTGPVNDLVNDAVQRGMVWFNAAGNHASDSGTTFGRYWRGIWVDDDGDGLLDFAPGDEGLGMFCSSGVQGFRWSDWSGNATDYDVYLVDIDGNVIAASENQQTSGAQPLELPIPTSIDCDLHPVVYLAVRLFASGNGTGGDVLEFMYNGGGLEYSSNPYSVSSPVSDSANDGVVVVGAIDPGDGSTIAMYSSQGPTNDSRTKPDVVAPSCYQSVAYAPDCFNGTSAATPIAAGVAALVSGAGVATSPNGIASYIRNHATDLGSGGVDNVYGHGQLNLGAPPVPLGTSSHLVGLVDPTQGLWHLYDNTGAQTNQFYFGNPGDAPILGDWDCDGVETVGMYRQSDGFVYLKNTNTQGNADIRFFFGNPGDVPVAGDFNGDGCATVSIYRPSEARFYIINKLGQNDGGLGAATTSYVFGNPGDKPFVGDFDGNGDETVGLHRESTGLVYFRNSHTQGNADGQFIFGNPGDWLVAGDWNDSGSFAPALFRPSNTTMYFRFTNTQGNADAQFRPAGSAPTWLPVAGHTD